jgi:hypothetical protein
MIRLPPKRAGLVVCIALTCLAAQAQAADQFVRGDYSYEVLRLESHQRVVTWEQDGVRTFVADGGAVLRQGPVRLAAPRMVVWFDRALSERPETRAAVVRVYAEGIEAKGGQRTPVRLAEGDQAREFGAVYMRFSSTMSFAWECPLFKAEGRTASVLLATAETRTKGVQQETSWEEVAPAKAAEHVETISRLLKANEVQFFLEEKPITVVYLGDVRGGYANLDLRADAAVMWYSQDTHEFEFYARGNVRVSRRPQPAPISPGEHPAAETLTGMVEHVSADELYINPQTARGLATHPELRLRDPLAVEDTVYVFRGQEAFLLDANTMTVKEVSLSTCTFAHPDYQFRGERAQVSAQKPGAALSAWDVRFQVGKSERTLLWLPFMSADVGRQAYLLTDYVIGSSKEFGAVVQTTWSPLDLTARPDWVDSWTVNLDYYSARGPAIGSELAYDIGEGPYPRHKGRVRAYYVSDSAAADVTDAPVNQQNRGRFHVENRSQLSEDWRVDVEYYHLSDAGFLREYFQADFEEEKTPESYVLARYLRNSTYLALLYKARVNDFLTQLEEKPSVDLEILALPLGRLVYDGSLVAGIYDYAFSNMITPAPPDPPSLTRLHTDHKVAVPFNAGIFRITPFVRALATAASDAAGPGGTFGGGVSRTGLGAGVTVSTTLSRTYDLVSDKYSLNRLRHVVVPYAEVQTLSVSGDPSSRFIQMDSTDAIDSGSQVTLGVRQWVQTKRLVQGQWQSVDWIEFDAAYVSRSSDSVMTSLDKDYARLDFEMLLSDHVSLHSRDNRIGLDGQPNVLNVGAYFDYLPAWALGLDYDFITNRTSAITADLLYKLSDRYQLVLFEQYDLDSQGSGQGASLATNLVIRRLLHDWVLDLGIQVGKANNGFAVIVGFGPKGFGVFSDPRRAGRPRLRE